MVNSALIVQDLKDAETNLVNVDLFKYSMESICFHIRSRTNLTIWCKNKKFFITNVDNKSSVFFFFWSFKYFKDYSLYKEKFYLPR